MRSGDNRVVVNEESRSPSPNKVNLSILSTLSKAEKQPNTKLLDQNVKQFLHNSKEKIMSMHKEVLKLRKEQNDLISLKDLNGQQMESLKGKKIVLENSLEEINGHNIKLGRIKDALKSELINGIQEKGRIIEETEHLEMKRIEKIGEIDKKEKLEVRERKKGNEQYLKKMGSLRKREANLELLYDKYHQDIDRMGGILLKAGDINHIRGKKIKIEAKTLDQLIDNC